MQATLCSRLASRPHLAAAGLAVLVSLLTIAVAVALDLPIRDPDGIAGPALVRLPLILALMFAIDVVPRGIRRARGLRGARASIAAVTRERWSRRSLVLVLVGLVSFYLTYVSYRNLKSFLPFVRERTADGLLLDLEPGLLLGEEPAMMLHDLLGTGLVAEFLSPVYVFFLVFVPLSLGAALVWTRDLARGFWYVTALGVNWVLGAASYYLVPSLGPVFVRPSLYAELPATSVSQLQETLLSERLQVLADPHATQALHGVAGFASLHVAIVFSAAIIAQLAGVRPALRRALWAFFWLTTISTMYFGWHYMIDVLAGLVIGLVAVAAGAVATGHAVSLRPALHEQAKAA
ncbi:MAG TPA: phosphatase PAP2 family protein [Solirubrobacteraceae bacterium]|nr:phosphatase PAP2 family protein [Solirubrobacteraceae bacterium]